MTTRFGGNSSVQYYGISYAFADMVRSTMPDWAMGMEVSVLTESPAGSDAVPPRPSTQQIERNNYVTVWASQITNNSILSTGQPDALSIVEWECRFYWNRSDPSALEQLQQYLTANLYNKWHKPDVDGAPDWNVVIRGAMLRENRLDQRIDAGFRWIGRLRFRSEVFGVLSAGLSGAGPVTIDTAI